MTGLQGGALLAAAIRNAAEPAALLGPNTVGVLSSVNTTETGFEVTVTNIPGMDDPLVIPDSDCSTWFGAEIAALGVGVDGIVGRRVMVAFTPGNQYFIVSTLGG